MLVSYPRSGNTWARFVLANLLDDEPTDFLTVEQRVPSIYVASSRALAQCPTPRVIKSHQTVDLTYSRVIYLVRDPRDVAASYHRYLQKVGDVDQRTPLRSFVRDFLDEQRQWQAFGTWRAHVTGWLEQSNASMIVVRYEDLIGDPLQEVARLAEFCEIDCTEATITKAVRDASPDRMRQLEAEQPVAVWSRVTDRIDYTRSDLSFVGTAVAGRASQTMDRETLATFDPVVGDVLERLGYA